jgi:alkanesulfonate monooxygenase SsuD/methylene tetrahydromethanopterin reductase-like flavin-dependent oxidoreductase (luciferase family)
VLLGALGDKMIATAGTHADGVLLNWLTVAGAAEAAKRYRAAMPTNQAAGAVGLLVRAGPHESLLVDAATYNERLPNYTMHFQRQRLQSTEEVVLATCTPHEPAVVAKRLAAYRSAGVSIPCLYPSGLEPDEVCQLVEAVGAAMGAGAAA